MTTFEIVISVIGVVLFVYLYCSARTSKNRYEELKGKFDVNVLTYNYSWYRDDHKQSQTTSRNNQELYNNLTIKIEDFNKWVLREVDRRSTLWYNKVVGFECDISANKKSLQTLEPVIKYLELKKKIEADATTKENLKKELADLKKQVNDLLK